MKTKLLQALLLAAMACAAVHGEPAKNPYLIGPADINNGGALELPVGPFTIETNAVPCPHPLASMADFNAQFPAGLSVLFGRPTYVELVSGPGGSYLSSIHLVQCGPYTQINLSCQQPDGTGNTLCSDDGGTDVSRAVCSGGTAPGNPDSCFIYVEGADDFTGLKFAAPVAGTAAMLPALMLSESWDGASRLQYAYKPGTSLLQSMQDAFGNTTTVNKDLVTGDKLLGLSLPGGQVQSPRMDGPDFVLAGEDGAPLLARVSLSETAVTVADGYIAAGGTVTLSRDATAGTSSVTSWTPLFNGTAVGATTTLDRGPMGAGPFRVSDPMETLTYDQFVSLGREYVPQAIDSSTGRSYRMTPMAGTACASTETVSHPNASGGQIQDVVSYGSYDAPFGAQKCGRPKAVIRNGVTIATASYDRLSGKVTALADTMTGVSYSAPVGAAGLTSGETVKTAAGAVLESVTYDKYDAKGELNGFTQTKDVDLTFMYANGVVTSVTDHGLTTSMTLSGAAGYLGTPGTVTLPGTTGQITIGHTTTEHTFSVALTGAPAYSATIDTSANGDHATKFADDTNSCTYDYTASSIDSYCTSDNVSYADKVSFDTTGLSDNVSWAGETLDSQTAPPLQ